MGKQKINKNDQQKPQISICNFAIRPATIQKKKMLNIA